MNIRRKRGFLIVSGLGFLIWLFMLVFYQKQILSLQYEISELEEKVKIENAIKRDLCIEITKLKNTERIEEVGKSSGLIETNLQQVIFLDEPKI
jgi:cell division protein FtsL